MSNTSNIQIENLAPESLEDITVLLDDFITDDMSIDIDELKYDVMDEHELEYIPNETWIQVNNNNFITFITSHDILGKLLYSPTQYEGVEVYAIDKYVIVSCCVDCGQGGGLLIVNSENGETIFSTNEMFIENLTYINDFDMFAFEDEFENYAFNGANLGFIMNGELSCINLETNDNLHPENSHAIINEFENITIEKVDKSILDSNKIKKYNNFYVIDNSLLFIYKDEVLKINIKEV